MNVRPQSIAGGDCLDEYAFRFNRRTPGSGGLLFYLLMEQAGATSPSPYRQMVGENHNQWGGACVTWIPPKSNIACP